MSLTTIAVSAARPLERSYKLFDDKGLFLSVEPTGGKLWRFKYRFEGKEKKLALGVFPATGLKDARARRDDARRMLEAGIDPAQKKKSDKLGRATRAASSFQAVAEEYIAKRAREGLASVTLTKAGWLLKLLATKIGKRPVAEITAQELLAALRSVEQRGNLETARRMRSFAGRVFRYAIATGRAERDLSSDIRDALTTPTVTHRAAILEPAGVGVLLRAVENYGGQPSTVLALRLAPHVFVRPSELRCAEWSEIDFEKTVWIVPGRKTKMRRDHQVPLSLQAVAILKEANKRSGGGRYVFPASRSAMCPISENTLNAALRRMKFGKDQMTTHGFRAIASTLLNESGKWNPDAIERALAHGRDSGVRAAYHRGAYWDERVRMAQWWSDHLDTLRSGATLIELRNLIVPCLFRV